MSNIETTQEAKPIVRAKARTFSYSDDTVTLFLAHGGAYLRIHVGGAMLELAIPEVTALYETLQRTHGSWRKKESWED